MMANVDEQEEAINQNGTAVCEPGMKNPAPTYSPTIMKASYMPLGEDSSTQAWNRELIGTPKMQASGSRRKKSKPIRVFLDYDEGEAANEMPRPVNGDHQGASGADVASTNGSPSQGALPLTPVENMDVDQEVNLSCDLCSDTFDNQESLTNHIQRVHGVGNRMVEDAYPTKYHQLGSQLQEAAMNNVITVEPEAPSTPRIEPPQQHNEDSGGSMEGVLPRETTPNGSKSQRIFHKDAYCETCDREFCNKYFLKTHKANKHGIYDSPTDMPLPGGDNNYPSFVPLPNPLAQLPMQDQAKTNALSSKPLVIEPKSFQPATHQASSTSNTPGSAVMVSNSNLLNPSKPADSTALATKPMSTATKTSTSASKPVPPHLEDYCEICQKHFCNKYYLRKHKQDVHGIVPDTPPMKRSRSTISSVPMTTKPTNNFLSNFPMSTTSGQIIPPGAVPVTSSSGLGNIPNLSSMANVMFINPFAPPVALVQAQQAGLQGMPPGFVLPPGAIPMPAIPTTSSSSSASPLTSGNAPTTSSPQNGSLPNDALRSMGVLNADAYCELCRKEFCNKYFLRIHKANKHGIYVDDGMPFPPPGMLLPFPLGDGNAGLIANHAEREKDLLKSMANHAERGMVKSNSEETLGKDIAIKKEKLDREHFCEPCGKDFGSKYSYKIHQMSVHGKLSDIDSLHQTNTDQGKDSGNEPIIKVPVVPMPHDMTLKQNGSENGDSGMGGTIFGNMMAAKLADRVMCEICNKEVCNKYFLKTHKLKVHGIVETPEKDSNSSGSGKTTPHSTDGDASSKKSFDTPKPESAERPRDDELLKMGIDPEAYCEICKKEFCSKYFLKTHKLNIHGIRENPIPIPEKSSTTTSSTSLISSHNPTSLSLPVSLPMPLMPGMSGIPSAPGMIPSAQGMIPPPPMLSQADLMAASLAGSMGASPGALGMMNMGPNDVLSSWKWKEPVNVTRVMCEICNKELCNKYFLKTHMLNKHGINYDVNTGQVSAASPGSGAISFGGPGSSFSSPCKDQPLPQSTLDLSMPSQTSGANSLKTLSLSATDLRRADQVDKTSDDGASVKSDHSEKIGIAGDQPTVSAKTWHVPASHPPQDGAVSTSGESDSKGPLKCEVCSAVFPEIIALQLHMIQAHQGQIMVKTPNGSSPPGEARAAMLNSLGISLKRKYNRGVNRKVRGGRRWRRLGQSFAGIGEKVKSAIVDHIKNHQRKKKFRCAYCHERFLNRPLCQAHIRSEHPNAKPSDNGGVVEGGKVDPIVIKQSADSTKSEYKVVPAKSDIKPMDVTDPKQIQSHDKMKVNSSNSVQGTPILPPTPGVIANPGGQSPFVMQPFSLKETGGGSHFASTVVFLPVLQKLSSTVTANFTLTPMEQ